MISDNQRRRARLSVCFVRHGVLALVASATMLAQAQGPGQTVGLLNQTNLIGPGDLPPHLALSLQSSGARMMTADKASVSLIGTITDSKGSRSVQITIQAPGYMSYRESQGRTVVFNDNGFQGNAGVPGSGDDPIIESLLAHFPDAVCLQVASGGSYRRLGSHFRADGSKGGGYTGPYWTILAFSPRNRPGLARGKALQQELFIAVDEKTGLIAEVRSVVNSAPKQPPQVTQTEFSSWTQQAGQWFPGKIVRLENGKQTLSFQLQQASVGVAAPTANFVP